MPELSSILFAPFVLLPQGREGEVPSHGQESLLSSAAAAAAAAGVVVNLKHYTVASWR